MAKPEQPVIVKVTMPPAMYEAVAARMAAERRSNTSEFIRNAIEDALSRSEQPRAA